MSEKTTDLSDQLGSRAKVLAPIFVDLGGKEAFSGKAVTLKCFEDNSRVKELSTQAGEGRVLVIDGGGSDRCALFGDHIAKDLADNGWAGVLVNGYVRDKAVLKALPLGVKALGVIPTKSVKRGEGQVGLSLRFAGQIIEPGDMVVADEDGVVILTEEL